VVVDRPFPGDLSVLVEPRLLTEDDLDWLYDLCRRRYSHRYDPISTEGWFRNIVLKNPMMFLPQRMPNAFCISLLSVVPWLPSDFECNVAFICADENCGWEALKLLRCSIAWAKARKCKNWKIASDTDADLTMLARRLGADQMWPRYVIRFTDE
jgi:hypothetical protein